MKLELNKHDRICFLGDSITTHGYFIKEVFEYLAKNRGKLENKVYAVPVEIDREVAHIKLRSNGINIDYLSDEQKAYLEAAE